MRRAVCAITTAAVLGLSAHAAAQGPPAQTAPPSAPSAATSVSDDPALTWHAFASIVSLYNFDRPPSDLNAERIFDFADKALTLDVVEIAAEKPAQRPRTFGFRADFEVGQAVPKVSAASGLFRDSQTGAASHVDLQQAYVSYAIREHVRVDAGKFVTPLGLEVIEGWDGYNDNASRSLLFGYAIPFTHTGVRVSVAGARASGIVVLTNGWDNVKDNNHGKTIAGQLTLTPNAAVSLSLGGISGPEQTGNDRDFRSVFDVVASFKINERTTAGVNADVGREPHAAIDGGLARWQGIAGYARIGWTNRVALCLRGEVFDDPQGARTGVAQRLVEVTVTPEVRASPHVVIRGDVRVDRSTQAVFDARRGAQRTQPTAAINLLLVF